VKTIADLTTLVERFTCHKKHKVGKSLNTFYSIYCPKLAFRSKKFWGHVETAGLQDTRQPWALSKSSVLF